jgi:hypothetical protein
MLATALLTGPARAALIIERTRENGANALRIGPHTFTLDRWIDFRQTNPQWFAQNAPRLGWALSKGKDYLLERRARNPRRFDYYHPFLGWLLRDPFPDELTNTGGPLPSLSVPPSVPPITPQSPPSGIGGNNPPGPQVVPEPASWILISSAAVGLGLQRLVRRKVPGVPCAPQA